MIERLKCYLAPLLSGGIALAFSGGVDSSTLLAVLAAMQRDAPFPLLAVYFQSLFQPDAERMAATAFAESVGVPLTVLDFDPLEISGVDRNPRDRCYRCKFHLFSSLLALAEKQQVKTILDGTNADDRKVYRPGRQALQELGVVSPMDALAFTKADVRALARSLELAVASKPASPCLATRFPYETLLTREAIGRVAEGEQLIRSMLGSTCRNLRLRVHGDSARIEVDEEVFQEVLARRQALTEALYAMGFAYVSLDLQGFRSGSMDN